MKKSLNIIYIILLLALGFEVLVGFPRDLNREGLQNQKESAEGHVSGALSELAKIDGARQRLSGVHLVESRLGAKDWELRANKAESGVQQKQWKMEDLNVHFYKSEKIEFTVVGKTGDIHAETRDMKIQGRVVTTSANGYVFRSEDVEYLANKRFIISKSAVVVNGPPDEEGGGFQIWGTGLEAHIDQKLMHLPADVRAKKTLGSGQVVEIRSKSAILSGEKRSLVFNGGTQVTIAGIRMESEQAEFQYPETGGGLKMIVLSGGVKLNDEDKFGTSDRISFEPKQNWIQMDGRPRIVQDGDEITGDQILLIDGGRRIKVQNIKAKMQK